MKALSFLAAIESHLQTQLPDYAEVKFSTDSFRRLLRVQCKLRGLLEDMFNCVSTIAQNAMPSSVPAAASSTP